VAKWILIVLVIVAAAFGAWFAITRIFPSDHRRLEWTLEDIRKAAESGDPNRCMSFVSSSYYYDGMNRQALEEFAKGMLEISGPMQIKVEKQVATVLRDGGAAVSAGEMLSLPCPGSKLPCPVRTSWQLMFQKEGKDWKVCGVQLESVNGERVDGLRGLLKLAQ